MIMVVVLIKIYPNFAIQPLTRLNAIFINISFHLLEFSEFLKFL